MDRITEREIALSTLRREKLAATTAAAILSGRRQQADISPVLRQLNSSDPLVRVSALEKLAELGLRQSITHVARCTNDAAPAVRSAACRALGALRAHDAKAALYDVLEDPKPEVRCAAAVALNMMGDRSGLAMVIKLLGKRGPHQLEALRALNRITRQRFPVNKQGIKSATRWLRVRRDLLT